MLEAFKLLAEGKLEDGLFQAEQAGWSDDVGDDLEGPFNLKLPGARFWGEGLMLASLLSRHAAATGRPVRISGDPQLLSILNLSPNFRCQPEASRPALAILKAALSGTLLQSKFQPIVPRRAEAKRPVGRRLRIGVAWASTRGKPIPGKYMDRDELLRLLPEGCELVGLQRGACSQDEAALERHSGRNVSQSILDAEDQVPILEIIGSLDMMVTVSTTTAHMAGALGVPTVLLAARRKHQQWFWRVQKEHGRCIYPSVRIALSSNSKPKSWWKSCLVEAEAHIRELVVGAAPAARFDIAESGNAVFAGGHGTQKSAAPEGQP